ncbi:MAG: hypothetical protein CMD07_00620 [Flavobacteriales bacterium]|nr:hypothetical protein [Flavobacteriales bacterium]
MKKMKKYLLALSLFISQILTSQDCSDLFISEYVEGWGNNKVIELFNPTMNPIDLSNYVLSRWSNGSTSPTPVNLSGTIMPNDAFVICIDKRDPNGSGFEAPIWNGWYIFTDSITNMLDSIYTEEEDLLSKVDLFICPSYDCAMYFNGNDAVTLETVSGDFIDIFGKIGEDPGLGWSDGTGAIWTQDHTLIRKNSVKSGFTYDPGQPYTFDPSLEWDSLPANTFVNLGFHDCNCDNYIEVSGCTDIYASNYDSLATLDDGSCEYMNVNINKSIDFSIYPNPSNHILNIIFNENQNDFKVKVISTIGRVLFEKKFGSVRLNKVQINLMDIYPGSYFVVIESNFKNYIKMISITQ